MKSMTLHAMDDQLAQPPAQPPHRDDFAGFCGTWAEDELKSFNQRVSDMDVVDRN